MDKVQRFFNPDESAAQSEGGIMPEVRQSYQIIVSISVF
jgi:hypothetical protein